MMPARAGGFLRPECTAFRAECTPGGLIASSGHGCERFELPALSMV